MFKVEVDGAQEAARRVKKLEDKVVTKAAHKRVAGDVFKLAERDVPEETGSLKRSGRVSGTNAGAVLRWGGGSVAHARPNEFGDLKRKQGGYVRANPWAFPAAESSEGQRAARDAFQDEADKLPREI